MNSKRVAVIAGLFSIAFATRAPQLAAQSCQDDQAMVDANVKAAADMVDTVKKESQADFESKFHQKSCLTKLTLALGALNDAVACLDKAGPSADAAAGQASPKDSDAKLKGRITQYKATLKSTDDPKAAKALIATFDFSAGLAKTADTAVH